MYQILKPEKREYTCNFHGNWPCLGLQGRPPYIWRNRYLIKTTFFNHNAIKLEIYNDPKVFTPGNLKRKTNCPQIIFE